MKRWMSVAGFIAVALAFGLLMSNSRADYIAVPLEERIRTADLVVLGRLVDVESKHFSIKWHGSRKIGNKSFYDTGRIEVRKVYKGSWPDDRLPISYDHPNQPKHPMRHMMTSYLEGQDGIWLLSSGGEGGYFKATGPQSFLEAGAEKDVAAALEKIKAVEGARPRIVVRKTEGAWKFEAYVEGKPDYKGLGASDRDAVGALILSHGPALGFDLQVTGVH